MDEREIRRLQVRGEEPAPERVILLPTDPLLVMRIRGDCATGNTFGMVRKGGTQPHQGWDLQAKVNTPVHAIADGTIEFVVVTELKEDYGKQICLKFFHGPQTYYAFYGHLSEIKVAQGQQVKAGDEIGKTGKTGNAINMSVDQEHLHFEIRTLPKPGKGLGGHIDPAILFGRRALTCVSYESGGDLGKKTDAVFSF